MQVPLEADLWHAGCNRGIHNASRGIESWRCCGLRNLRGGEMSGDQSVVVDAGTHRAAIPCAERFGDHGPTEFISMPGRRVLKLLCNAHHIFYLALVTFTFDMAIGLALACYGATIGLIVFTLRMTRDRNMRYTWCDQVRST
jgi:hypothetical protein